MPILDAHKVCFVDLDPRGDSLQDGLMSLEELKVIQIGPKEYQTPYIVTTLLTIEESEITQLLRDDVNMFTWLPTDMPDRSR